MLPWLVRCSWLLVPFTCGAVIADALDGRSSSVQLVAAGLLWSGWAIVVVALLVPRPAGVVALRAGALAALGVALWAAADEGDAADWILAASALAPLGLSLWPAAGEWLVNGGAYGYERRYVLRLPAPLYGPAAIAALLLPVAVGAGPLLLAAEQWLPGVVALAAGGALAFVLGRALVSLTQRWVVLVPAGLVVKDHFALLDPVLFRRLQVESIALALDGTDALDLTAGARGRAIEVQLGEKEPITKVTFGRREQEMLKVGRFIVTPTRPGALLTDAAARRFRVSGRQAAVPPPSTTSRS